MSLAGAPLCCGAEHGGDVFLDGREAAGVVYWSVRGLIGHVGHASLAIIVAPCVCFYNVAMQVS